MANKRFYRNSRKETIDKAWHLLNAFDYDFIKRKDIIPLESGCAANGRLNYILITTTAYTTDYKFTHDPYKGWSMDSTLREDFKAKYNDKEVA